MSDWAAEAMGMLAANGVMSGTSAIPSDYGGVMGVPISFLDKYNPEQFEIVGIGVMPLVTIFIMLLDGSFEPYCFVGAIILAVIFIPIGYHYFKKDYKW